jgi:hypothetical protein
MNHRTRSARSALSLCAIIAASGCVRRGSEEVERAASASASGADGTVAAGSAGGCAPWGGRGFSLVVRAQSSHALFFREFAYDDRTGVARVHDSDLFAAEDGHESSVPRVIERSVTLEGAERERLARELTGLCANDRELADQEAPGGGTVLRVTTASGAQSTVRYAQGAQADVARRTHARFVQYFQELRRQ